MRIPFLTACCLLAFAACALGANPITTLHPGDADELKAALIDVSCTIHNGKYAFEITARVPEGFDSVESSLFIQNDKEEIQTSVSWISSEGSCTAVFMLGEEALGGAGFTVQRYQWDRFKPGSAAGGYNLKLSEFLKSTPVRDIVDHFEIKVPIKGDAGGPELTIAVTMKDTFSNFLYDLHISVEGRSDQHFELYRLGPITKRQIRLASVDGDANLDIMILQGTDDHGRARYKTLIYDEKKQKYHWLSGQDDG